MQLPVLNSADHEAKCRRCGVTCHLPVEVGSVKYVVEGLHCRFLVRDANSRYSCSVYENRFERAPWCHSAKEALATGHLAADCPYAADVPNFNGRLWAPPDVLEKLVPIVRQELIANGLPISGNPEGALSILARTGEAWLYTEQEHGFVFYQTG